MTREQQYVIDIKHITSPNGLNSRLIYSLADRTIHLWSIHHVVGRPCVRCRYRAVSEWPRLFSIKPSNEPSRPYLHPYRSLQSFSVWHNDLRRLLRVTDNWLIKIPHTFEGWRVWIFGHKPSTEGLRSKQGFSSIHKIKPDYRSTKYFLLLSSVPLPSPTAFQTNRVLPPSKQQ